MSKKTQVIRFCLFILLFLVSFSLLNYPYGQRRHRRNEAYWDYFYQVLPENSTDIVFLGNSHSQCTFSPEVIDDLLGTNSINLITADGSIYQTKFEYQEVLRYQQPRLVVIESHAIYGGRNQETIGAWNYAFFESMPFSLRKISYVFSYFSFENFFHFLFPLLDQHADWKNPRDVIDLFQSEFGKLFQEETLELPHSGYLPLKYPLPEDRVSEYALEMMADEFDQMLDFEQRLEMTADALEIDRQNPEKLLILEAPQYVNPYENLRKEVIELVDQYPADYAQVFGDAQNSKLWYQDIYHLSQFGSLKASLESARIIAEYLYLEIDQNQYAYYQSYLFSNYTLTRDGQSYLFELYPENPENSRNLEYEWIILKDGENILQESTRGESSLELDIPEESGRCELQVKIHNPAGEYILEGIFILRSE